jgi:hypothetical protein
MDRRTLSSRASPLSFDTTPLVALGSTVLMGEPSVRSFRLDGELDVAEGPAVEFSGRLLDLTAGVGLEADRGRVCRTTRCARSAEVILSAFPGKRGDLAFFAGLSVAAASLRSSSTSLSGRSS